MVSGSLSVHDGTVRGVRAVVYGVAINATLAAFKLAAGLIGNSYALVADAVESTSDIISSLIVWGGLRVAVRDPDDDFPFGYGKAEALAAAIVSLILILAGIAIATVAVLELRLPHHTPAFWTLGVLVAVVATKWILARRVYAVGADIGSTAVKADAWHHRSDAITSAAAFIGISIALLGGPRWAAADNWAAIAASGIVIYNGVAMLRAAVFDLMDRVPGPELVAAVRAAAEGVAGVLATEKLAVRKAGMAYWITLHVQANAEVSLHDAHVLSGMVKSAIRTAVPAAQSVLVHMEPYEAKR